VVSLLLPRFFFFGGEAAGAVYSIYYIGIILKKGRCVWPPTDVASIIIILVIKQQGLVQSLLLTDQIVMIQASGKTLLKQLMQLPPWDGVKSIQGCG
jgi:hypothetical protein